jgi:hypothetical protein
MPSNDELKSTARYPRWQFSLRTLLIVVTAVGIVLATVTWLGKDGLALAALGLPMVLVFLLVEGGARYKLRIALASTLLAFGVVWIALFPKTADVLAPDFVASVALGVGLIGGGLCILVLPRKSVWLTVVLVLLLWSTLLSLFLLAQLRAAVQAIQWP